MSPKKMIGLSFAVPLAKLYKVLLKLVGEGEAILFPRFFFLQIPIDKKGNT